VNVYEKVRVAYRLVQEAKDSLFNARHYLLRRGNDRLARLVGDAEYTLNRGLRELRGLLQLLGCMKERRRDKL